VTPIHICMLVHATYPDDPRVRRAAHAARDAGHRVDVVCLSEPGRPADELVEGVRVRRLGVAKQRGGAAGMLLEYVRFTLMSARLLAGSLVRGPRYDAIHVNNPPDFLIAAGLLPKLFGRRLIFDVHDLSRLMFTARFGGSRVERPIVAALTLIERFACSVADEVVTVSEQYRHKLGGEGFQAEPVTIVMNSPDDRLLERVRAAGSERRREPGRFLICYHGTITPWYGLPLLVRALAAAGDDLGDWRCVIVGDGDDVEETRRVGAELGVSARLDFRGRRPLEETLTIVSDADCGVIPNLPCELNRFTLSTKLLEYATLGVPAVVARLDTLAWHFGPDEATFFEPGDEASLADALRWVGANPGEARAKAERAARRVEAYAWPANRERYLRLLANGHTPASTNATSTTRTVEVCE
jgi:glycosyltransferase involved in cell wall biosynthesis